MKKTLLFASLFLGLLFTNAQTASKWSDLFSYNNVLSIKEDGDRLIAATENGIFYYYPNSGEVKKLSKANGLHEVKISAFDYNPNTKVGIVGYQNGAMDVITPEGIFLVVDIPIANGYLGNKKINHISIHDDKAIISVGYGVSIFDLNRREFGDTAFFSNGGNYVDALEAIIINNKAYVSTATGILTHEINTTFPVFTSWTTFANGNYKNIAAKDIIAIATPNQVRFGTPESLNNLSQSFNNVKDVVITDDKIIVSDENRVFLFSKSGTLEKGINVGENINSATSYNNQIFTGSQYNGMLNESLTSIKPDGPYNNASYKLDLQGSQILISSGDRTSFNDPIIKNLGYYLYDGTKWNYPDYFKNFQGPLNVLDAVINPIDPTEIFFTNYTFNANKGIYKMSNNEFVKSYQITGDIYRNRTIGLTFDENNNLFASVAVMSGNFNNGFLLYNKSSDSFTTRTFVNIGGAQSPYTKDGILYIPAPYSSEGGLLLYDYNNTTSFNDDQHKLLKTENNLPINGVASIAVDKSDNVWIGSRQGLRILSNPKSAILEERPQTDPIIIEQGGLGEELFRDAEILQIAVDSGNQKWVSTAGGGVFYISPSGDQTYQHFTKSNSPLPNNQVTDIKVDNKTGKVYFATLDGVVVYQGDVGDVTSNFGDVLVYPNPVVYAQYKGNVRIKGLAEKTNIRITDAAGNVIHTAVARGGYYEWNLNNHRGVRVASGIYYVLMTNEDSTDTATAKIAVVN